MWPFSKKRYSLIDSGLLQGMTDCHSHILPGVDDGVQTLEDSLRTLQILGDLGVSKLWFTPHIMEDIPNTTADLKKHFVELTHKLPSPKIELHLAAEHMLDGLFARRFAEKDVLPLGALSSAPAHPLLLVETSYFNPPLHFWDMLEDIRRQGYTPVLAHPERYVYMHGSDYQRLTDMGVILQLNLLSLTGAYGEGARHKALRLLYSGFYTLMGTDLHNVDDFVEYASEKCLTQKDIDTLAGINTL